MRVIGIVVVAWLAAGCDKPSIAEPDRGSAAVTKKADDDIAREQAQFDAQRHPETVVAALALRPGSRVADIGAGSGLLTVHLARAVAPGGKVIATDIDGGVLDMLRARLTAAKLLDVVEPRVVSADTPSLEKGAYDAILLSEVDNYFTDPVAWLRDAAKAVKPGGRIVIANRIHRLANSLAAARQAGLKLDSQTTPVPTHFIAVFIVGSAPKGAE